MSVVTLSDLKADTVLANSIRMSYDIAFTAWTPLQLFQAGEPGSWYARSDLDTLFQDRAGTTQVTADGQTLGHMLDKSSNDNHATAPSDAARPLTATRGGEAVIEGDFVDDSLVATNTLTTGDMVVATPYGWQYTPDMQFGGVNFNLSLNWPTEIIIHEGLSGAQLTEIANRYGTRKFMIAVTNDSTLSRLRVYLTDSSTTDLLIIGANGDTTTITLGANSNSALDLSTTTLTAPYALVWDEVLIGNTALQNFRCDFNQLTGAIPDLSANTALRNFRCHFNQLTGAIPDLSANTELRWFYCHANQLIGSIPDLSANTALQTFFCYANQLTGSIPDLSANTDLDLFYCYSNQLDGWVGGVVSNTIIGFEAQDNLLPESAVNGLLVAFDNAGGTNGTLKLGGTGNAAATGAGLTAKTSLEGKGWTVTVN